MSHFEVTKLFTDPVPTQTKFSAVPQGQTQKNLKVWIEDKNTDINAKILKMKITYKWNYN